MQRIDALCQGRAPMTRPMLAALLCMVLTRGSAVHAPALGTQQPKASGVFPLIVNPNITAQARRACLTLTSPSTPALYCTHTPKLATCPASSQPAPQPPTQHSAFPNNQDCLFAISIMKYLLHTQPVWQPGLLSDVYASGASPGPPATSCHSPSPVQQHISRCLHSPSPRARPPMQQQEVLLTL